MIMSRDLPVNAYPQLKYPKVFSLWITGCYDRSVVLDRFLKLFAGGGNYNIPSLNKFSICKRLGQEKQIKLTFLTGRWINAYFEFDIGTF